MPTYVDNDDDGLKELPLGFFNDITDCEVLRLNHNRLTTLPPEIRLLTNLGILRVSQNCITELPEEFGELRGLEGFYARNNLLRELPESFGGLRNLKYLDLMDNLFPSFPHVIKSLETLRMVRCDSTWLEDVEGIYEMTWLTSLYTKNSQTIIHLPETIGQLVNLEFLSIGHTTLGRIPSEINQLQCLKVLHLRGDNLDIFPPITGLSNLETLNLAYNDITCIPADIQNLTNLQVLCIHHNRLTTLPPEIGRLHNLWYLKIENNPITRFPEEISNLVKLTIIRMWFTRIDVLPLSIGRLREIVDVIPNVFNERAVALFDDFAKQPDMRPLWTLKLPPTCVTHVTYDKIPQQRKRRRKLGQLELEARLLY